MLSVRFEVGVSLLLAPVGADKRGPKAPFPLLENAGMQPEIRKRVPAGALLSLSFQSPVFLFLCGWILSITDNFTCSIKEKSGILSCNNCYGLRPLLTVLEAVCKKCPSPGLVDCLVRFVYSVCLYPFGQVTLLGTAYKGNNFESNREWFSGVYIIVRSCLNCKLSKICFHCTP